ncbi:MAG: threonine-phosphate decarboxylase CobD [Rhodomicrobium sp.]
MSGSLAGEIDLRFFQHGGRLDVARARYPEAPEPWIDLSTGISPWAYPVPHLAAGDFHRLPDGTALHRLIEIARKAYRVPPLAAVVALPGTDAGLSILPWLFREPKRVAVLGPCYSGHAAAWTAAGHSVAEAETIDRTGSAAIVIAVNPNNPDGRFTPHAALAAALPALKRRDGLLIVDEAFADADETHSLLPHVARLDYTLVLRSVGKFFGAGGVRLGFAITSHPVAGRLREALGAWPISAQAIAFGEAALADAGWAAAQRSRLKEAANQLGAMLTEAGCRILGGTSLFRLVEHPASRQLFAHLAGKGILTRPFKDSSALRFGLPTGPEEFGRLQAALQTAPKE